MVAGVVIAVAVCLAVNAAYLHVLSYDALARSPLVAADVMRPTRRAPVVFAHAP